MRNGEPQTARGKQYGTWLSGKRVQDFAASALVGVLLHNSHEQWSIAPTVK